MRQGPTKPGERFRDEGWRECCRGCGRARTAARGSLATAGYVYLFGAACAERMLAVGHDRANAANEHLASASVQPGNRCVPVLDGAGRHRSKELEIPENMTLLPPCSPELNGEHCT